MDTKRICSVCGRPLTPGAPEGLCPECLLQAGLGTGVDIGPDTGGQAPRFVPPQIEELAAKFPQLEILEFIGQGGMGAVYKARQKQLDRIVALKILPPQAGRVGFAERFTREARALAKLNHPHIVTLYEFGQSDGLFYFLMEFVNGVNLRQLLGNSRISSREALAIVPQICEALQFAHDSGIVHRDIKPENILLDKKGQVKIADFGVAKMIAESLTEAAEKTTTPGELTEAGSTLGTPQYMAPEQIKNSAEVDHRADIYSLGVVFYQMLTGELPSSKIEPPSRKVHIDVRLDQVVLRALEKKPELRFQQVSDVKTLVETIATTPQPSPAPPLPPFKLYKDSKWKFELDIPEGWRTSPPVRENSIYELIRFGSQKNGRHLLILFLKRHLPGQSLQQVSDGTQKILANAGFGNFVSTETTIGGKPARILDFDRPEGNNTWSCREYFVAEGELLYTLGFGTTGKAAMFETFDHMAKSFRFQTTGHQVGLHQAALEPYFPKTETTASGPPSEPGQMSKTELPPEGYIVRMEPIPEARPAKTKSSLLVRSLLGMSLVGVALIALILAALFTVGQRRTSAYSELTEAGFLQKFDAGQIAQAEIIHDPARHDNFVTISGKFLHVDANGTPLENNGIPVMESFLVHNVALTPPVRDKLLKSGNVHIMIPNPVATAIGYQLLFLGIPAALLLFLLITGIYFVVRAIKSPLGNGPPKRRSRLAPFFIIGLVAFAITSLLWLFVHVHTVRFIATQTGVPFHFRVFEADANLVDQLIPAGQRRNGVQPNTSSAFARGQTGKETTYVGNFSVTTSGAETESQLAFISPHIVNALLEGIPPKPGVLAERTRLVTADWWNPGLSDGWGYSVGENDVSGGGGANAFFGVQNKNGATAVRIDCGVTHSVDDVDATPSLSLYSRFLYEGPLPPTNALVFLVPFLRHDSSPHYLVTVFDFDGQNNEEPFGLDLNAPPFKVQVQQATVELACIGDEPWTNPVCWYPNGQLFPKPFPTGNSDSTSSAMGMEMKKVVFYLSTQGPNGISMPVCVTKDNSGNQVQGSFWMQPYAKHKGYFGVNLASPSNTLAANLSIAVAAGPWETVISMEHSPNSVNGLGTSGNWTGRYEAVKGTNGDIALGCSYSTTSNWISRMVYVNDHGDLVPIKETSSDIFGNPDAATLLLSSNEYAGIKTFLVQRRKMSWVKFDHISLQQGYPTEVTVSGDNISLPLPPMTALATAAPAGSKRQRFVPVKGMEEKTTWGVENHSEFNTNGWAVLANMTLGGMVHVQPWMLAGQPAPAQQSPDADLCRIKLVNGDDHAITLSVEDIIGKNTMTIHLYRDQPTDITINNISYRIGCYATWVAPDQPGTKPSAYIVLTRSQTGR